MLRFLHLVIETAKAMKDNLELAAKHSALVRRGMGP